MKKLMYVFLALICLESGLYAYNGYYYSQQRASRRSQQRQRSSQQRVNCMQCCAEHRFVSDECLNNCNQCQQYHDGGAAEGRDHPY